MLTCVEIVLDNVGWMDLGTHISNPAYFSAGADDITKKREPGIAIIERTPKSLIITSCKRLEESFEFHVTFDMYCIE